MASKYFKRAAEIHPTLMTTVQLLYLKHSQLHIYPHHFFHDVLHSQSSWTAVLHFAGFPNEIRMNQFVALRVLFRSSVQNVSFFAEKQSLSESKRLDRTSHTVQTEICFACHGISSVVVQALRITLCIVVTS